MTLIVALKYKDGVILASDSRVMIGPALKRDQARKLEPLTESIGAAAAGLVGAIDDVLRRVKEFCSSRVVTFDEVVSYLSDVNYQWYEENYRKLEEGEGGPVFIVVSPERIRRIFEKGYSEEAYDYACEGSGRTYGEYILRNLYDKELDVEQAKELAVYTIVETSKMDPNVGEDISMLIFPKEGKCEPVDKAEIESIKERLIPLSRKISEAQIRTVEEIVKKRENINDLWKKKFGFKLFHPNEIAIFQIMKPCRNEEEFTNNIAALALLVDQLNVEEMKKVVGEKEGSVNILEAFLTKNLKEFTTEIISNFRDIITLRSKKFPIHVTDTKFVEVVIRICGKYPPAWTNLWLEVLSRYKESLDKLLEHLQSSP